MSDSHQPLETRHSSGVKHISDHSVGLDLTDTTKRESKTVRLNLKQAQLEEAGEETNLVESPSGSSAGDHTTRILTRATKEEGGIVRRHSGRFRKAREKLCTCPL